MPATASVVVITMLPARGQIIIFHGKLKLCGRIVLFKTLKKVKDLHIIHNEC